MRLTNTLSRKKEELTPQKDVVSVYTCGPTVYLDPHIGNWRSFIFYDTLIRSLQLNGYKTKHVINITDVGHLVSDADDGEDKLAKQAAEERKTAWEVAEFYTEKYQNERKLLNMLEPDEQPKATDHIEEQIEMVKELEAAGVTYQIDDGVYFDTSQFENYGQLAKLDLEGQEAGARVETNDQKKNPQDFALWKLSPKDTKRDMEWDSPWGKGFPGWHLECSVMAKKYLGDTLDIHAGGVDHIPIHHTNEIAQSETANGQKFANIWLHGEFMKVDGQKMSKSLGNIYTLDDLSEKGYEPLAYRLLVLQGHYRTETNFSWDNLSKAADRLRNFLLLSERRWQPIATNDNPDRIIALRNAMIEALEDDLNTPQALAIFTSILSLANNGLSESLVEEFSRTLQDADSAFGLDILKQTPDITLEQKNQIEERTKLKAEENYTEADKIRDQLTNEGLTLLDPANRTLWQRIR